MKNLLYTTSITLLLMTMGCKSIQKMVDNGEYDKAIQYATEKLAGKKDKKTKYVKALDRAFDKVMRHDLDRLDYLSRKNDPSLWIQRYDILTDIDARQRKIEPYLPLVSKDGYRARFDMIDVSPLLIEAGQGAAEYHYQLALAALISARSGDRRAGRDAYAELDRIARYYDDYKDRYALMAEAHELGITDVLISIDEDILIATELRRWDADRALRDMRDEFWVRYHVDGRVTDDYDVHMRLRYGDMYITPEREFVDRYDNSTSEDKEVDRRDSAGNVVKDSTGTILKDIIAETYTATITEITRTKGYKLVCDAIYIDHRTGRILDDEELNVTLDFENKSASYTGDKRALADETRQLLDSPIQVFPSDWEMSRDAMEEMAGLYRRFIKKQRLDR